MSNKTRKEKFTPGPWHAYPYAGRYAVQREEEGGFIISGTSDEREAADANLIAAAPEMYDLLEDCMCKINDYSDDESRELIKEILSLRRKARGGNNE